MCTQKMRFRDIRIFNNNNKRWVELRYILSIARKCIILSQSLLVSTLPTNIHHIIQLKILLLRFTVGWGKENDFKYATKIQFSQKVFFIDRINGSAHGINTYNSIKQASSYLSLDKIP